jgi:DHA1 family bicyclomycin/chloramphenicol resistance-like MFS transporter
MTQKMSNGLLWACLSVAAIVPLSTDMFIAGFPEMSRFFATNHIGWVISAFLIGNAVSQPFYGPLLDRFGRRPVILTGLFIFVLASAVTLFAHNYWLFLLARFAQALGGCSTMAGSFAIIHDTKHHDHHGLVAAMGGLMALIGVCPAVSPLIGSVLVSLMDWHLVFYVLFGLGCLFFLWTAFALPETQAEKNLSAHKLQHVWHNYRTVFSCKSYVLYCFISALSYGTIFAYLTVASLFIIRDFHYPAMMLGWVSLVLGVIIFVCSIYVPRLVKRISLAKAAFIGVLFILLGAIVMLLVSIIWGSTFYTFVGPILISVIGVGFIRPVASAGSLLGVDKKIIGSASSGFNFVSFIGGAIVTAAVGHFSQAVPPFAGFLLVLALLALVLAFFNRKHVVAG